MLLQGESQREGWVPFMGKGGTGQNRALEANADYGDLKEREGQQEHHGWKFRGRKAPGVSRGQCKGKQTKNDRSDIQGELSPSSQVMRLGQTQSTGLSLSRLLSSVGAQPSFPSA